MNFEFHPFGQTRGGGQAREADGFLGVHGAAGVGQEEVTLGVDEFENVREGILLSAQVGAAQGDGDQFRAAGGQGVAHRLGGSEFARPDQQAGAEFTSGDNQRVAGSLHARAA